MTITSRLVQRKARRWGPVLFCCAASTLVGSYLLAAAPRAYEVWRQRAPLRELSRQAVRENLSYDDVVADPAAAKGRVVRWPITHPGDFWYCGENPERRVTWASGPPDMAQTGQSGSSRGEWVLARVVSATRMSVALEFIGFD